MESNLQKIDHIVVLMLENRSFDNMLGFLGASDSGGQKSMAWRASNYPIPFLNMHNLQTGSKLFRLALRRI